MESRSPHQAVRYYVDSIQKALSCITKSVANVSHGGYDPAKSSHAVIVNRGDPIPLVGSARLSLDVSLSYHIASRNGEQGPWRVTTDAYYVAFLDREGPEILAYHWHPLGRSLEKNPHLHLGAGARIGRQELMKAHLPTSFIAMEDIIRLAIEAFKVPPQRNDWQAILSRTNG